MTDSQAKEELMQIDSMSFSAVCERYGVTTKEEAVEKILDSIEPDPVLDPTLGPEFVRGVNPLLMRKFSFASEGSVESVPERKSASSFSQTFDSTSDREVDFASEGGIQSVPEGKFDFAFDPEIDSLFNREFSSAFYRRFDLDPETEYDYTEEELEEERTYLCISQGISRYC